MNAATIEFETVADPSSDNPLTTAHRRELGLARERSKSIRRVARVAAFNGWTTGLMAALSAPFALFSSSGLVITAAMSLIALNEFRGRRRVLAYDPRGTMLLGFNQLVLLAIILAYCGWSLYSNLTGPGPFAADRQTYAELEAALGSLGNVESLWRQIVVLLYGTVIALSIFFQGGNALYYFSRCRRLKEFVKETPAWIRELRCGAFTA